MARDTVLYNELMIGCLWAAASIAVSIVALMRRYFKFGPTAKYGHDRRMLVLMPWPLIRSCCLVYDKHHRPEGVNTVRLTDPKSHFDAGRQNLQAMLGEFESLGILRVL